MPYAPSMRRRAERRRRIRIAAGMTVAVVLVGGISYAAVAHVDQPVNTHVNVGAAALPKPRPEVDALGDSYTEGAGQSAELGGYVWRVATREGWQVRNYAEGGTGYLTDGPQNVTGPRHRIGYFVPAVIANRPALVIVAAGINDRAALEDTHSITLAQLVSTARADWEQLRAGLPASSKVVVIGPFWPNGFPTAGILAIDRALAGAAAQLHLPYLDPVAEHWITGRWDVPASGNAHRMIGPDKTHPTQAGHDYIAGRVVADLTRLGIRLHG